MQDHVSLLDFLIGIKSTWLMLTLTVNIEMKFF